MYIKNEVLRGRGAALLEEQQEKERQLRLRRSDEGNQVKLNPSLRGLPAAEVVVGHSFKNTMYTMWVHPSDVCWF